MGRWNRLWDRSNLLRDILSHPDNKEYFLDVKRAIPLSPEMIRRDAGAVGTYARTEDYAVWAQEAWSRVIMAVHKLRKDDLTESQVNFYRGSLSEAMELLEISYKAHRVLQEKSEAEKA